MLLFLAIAFLKYCTAVGAAFGTMGILIFSFFLTATISEATPSESRAAFKYVILVSSGIVAFVGVLVWFFLKLDQEIEKKIVLDKISIVQIKEVLGMTSVRLLMLIILCAYIGYKVTDIISLYAQDVMLYDQVESAQVGTFLLYIRPVIGVTIGILADRTHTTYLLIFGFIITFFGALLLATSIVANATILFFISILVVATGVYASRSLYFAVMESGQIPLVLTGTAVGLISIIGFTPDIFIGPIIGYLLEESPGKLGHQQVFGMLAFFSFIGGIAAWYYYRLYGVRNSAH